MPEESVSHPEAWYVLVCGLPLEEESVAIGPSIIIRRLASPLSVFDLAAAGAAGFREWATLEPLAPSATAEIEFHASGAQSPGYDALGRCWLVSTLLVLRAFARHICPAVSAYSWNFVAGRQQQASQVFKEQMAEEGIARAVYHPRSSLPPFQGGLLDYHLKVYVPASVRSDPFDGSEANWIAQHFDAFDGLSAKDERFRVALEAAVDWRFARDSRSAIARLWARIESLSGAQTELIFRLSLFTATVAAPRGEGHLAAFKAIKKLYSVRSKAVHGEPLPADVIAGGVRDSFELLRALLLDAVARGKPRSEDDLFKELLC